MPMLLPPLQIPGALHPHISGDVTIDPGAGIAPGVLLLAEPGSQIWIAAGVCIGMGSILHAHHGPLIIEAGVTLGTGVLVVGTGRIGANACVGSATTLVNCTVAPGQVVPPGSLLGDTSRRIAAEVIEASTIEASTIEATAPVPPEPDPWDVEVEPVATPDLTAPPPATTTVTEATTTEAKTTTTTTTTTVYGQAHFNQLMVKIFAQRQAAQGGAANSAEEPPGDAPALGSSEPSGPS